MQNAECGMQNAKHDLSDIKQTEQNLTKTTRILFILFLFVDFV